MAVLAIGMSEKNDSVCNDVAYHYHILSNSNCAVSQVRIFAGHYDPAAFPDLPVEDAGAFYRWLEEDENIVVLFHYCDSRTQYDDFLRKHCQQVIVRWHNATPPWFTFGSQNQNANHALLGYENIIDFIDCKHINFWGNSSFTKDQLVALGASPEQCHVVYPASRYLDLPTALSKSGERIGASNNTLDLLFVSRVVAHKGHINAVTLADRVQEITGKPVRLNIVGKGFDDPNAFSAQLRQTIREAKSEVIVHGLVSDEALITLYQDSDVFVCLSEHEGFGLPVFEAMRYRLPVVAWATTAFRELLENHPFAFSDFDLDLFASAVSALEEAGVKERLLEIQYAVLQTYTSNVLRTQIKKALAAQESLWGQPVPDDLGREAIRYLPRVAGVIDRKRRALRSLYERGYDDSLIFDAHINVTSLYDLRMFKQYLDQDKELVRRLTANIREPSVSFRPDEFSMRKGVFVGPILPDQSLPDVMDIRADHLIFGPYVQMPSGQYRADMEATIAIVSEKEVSFEIDINSGGKQLLSRIITLSPGTNPLQETLLFELVGEAPMVELRLRAAEAFHGYVVFMGVTLTKTNTHDAPISAKNLTPVSSKIWFLDKLPQVGPLVQMAHERQARDYFRKGNAARDIRAWDEAAQFYDLGLRLLPERFAYIVQSAHMHKEMGDFETAQMRYEQAYNLKPDDADLCLQMGHFYKLVGKKEAARNFYLKAITSYGSTAADAGTELLMLSRS